MANEILSIPEEQLREVITVIRTGILNVKNVSNQTIRELTEWCNDEEAYIDSTD